MNQTNVLHRYSNRDITLNELNLYKFCAFHWNFRPDAIIPHFFGFRDVGTWPLKEEYSKYNGCTTHPHQLYFELLSETGIVGFLLFTIFLVYTLYRSKIHSLQNYNGIKLASTLYIISSAIPFLPSGSFFTSFGATIFWINIAIITKGIKNDE